MSTNSSGAPSRAADGGRSRPGRAAALGLAYAAGAVLFTWPLALRIGSRLGAPIGIGDPYLNLWILGWDLRTISLHPAWLLSGRVFDANIFYPAAGTLAYSDHQLLQAIAVWPLYAVTGNLTLCYNAVLLASLVLSGWAMHAFVREVSGSEGAAWTAGLVWAFCPYRFTHLLHLQLQALYLLPLSFLFLHRTVVSRRRRDALWLGLTAGLQVLASVYYGLIGAVGLAVGAVVLIAASGAWRTRRVLASLALAGAVALAVAAPSVWPYWRVARREGFSRELFQAASGSAVPASYLQAPPTNLLYGRTGLLRPGPGGGGPLHRKAGPEQDLFPGFTVLVLAAAGLIGARAVGAVKVAAQALAVGVVGFGLSLGPDGVRPVYAALHRWVFGFQAVRAPARFSVLVFFALAVLGGIGVEWLCRTLPRSPARARWPAAAAAALVVVEFLNGPLPLAAAPPASTAVGRWLAAADGPGAVLYLPLTIDADSTRFMVASLEHARPIVNGYSGQRPAFYPALVETMAGFPSADALLALSDLHVRFVVAPAPLHAGPGPSPLVERAALADGVVYELRWTPAILSALEQSTAGAPPPAPGPPPFGTSETARYRVRWLDGPLTVAAGEVVIEATRSADTFEFAVTAATAPWMQAFFEAHDRFETRADARLLPLEHRQELREGRRRIDRRMTFEAADRRVRIVTGDAAPLVLPLRPSARDPISAFFYLRTLPLAPGYRVRIPISDAGRATTLDLRVAGPDTVTIDGRSIEALKIEPRLVSRVERRPLDVTAWISRDARRVPLAVHVSAGFGSVVLELVDYRAR